MKHETRCIGYLCTCKANRVIGHHLTVDDLRVLGIKPEARSEVSFGIEWIERTQRRLKRALERSMRGYASDPDKLRARMLRALMHASHLGWTGSLSELSQAHFRKLAPALKAFKDDNFN